MKKYIFIIFFILFYSFVKADDRFLMFGKNKQNITAVFGLNGRLTIKIHNGSNLPVKFNRAADQYFYGTKDKKAYLLEAKDSGVYYDSTETILNPGKNAEVVFWTDYSDWVEFKERLSKKEVTFILISINYEKSDIILMDAEQQANFEKLPLDKCFLDQIPF